MNTKNRLNESAKRGFEASRLIQKISLKEKGKNLAEYVKRKVDSLRGCC
jgi:hypothetical protein